MGDKVEFVILQPRTQSSDFDISFLPKRIIEYYGKDNIFSLSPTSVTGDLVDLEGGVEEIIEFINSEEPFDGLLGFSQGGYSGRALYNLDKMSVNFTPINVPLP